MSVMMKGSEVVAAMKEELLRAVEKLVQKGVVPQLDIVRVGVRPDDLAYERGAMKRMEGAGIHCKVIELPESISQADFEKEFSAVNGDPDIHGILLFRPLPKQLDEESVRNIINPKKDIDCLSPVNMAKVFSGDESGFAPCTPEAVMEVLAHYGIDVKGKRVTVVGRSMDLGATCRNAEILIAAAGKTAMITADFVSDGTVVVDVGINVNSEGKLCGDVDFAAVEPKCSYITPVPGGVGTVTSSMLAKHVVRAAGYLNGLG
jgi:methylenetetrahydrofolate dehydrogenase (NADP+)/methenyltetrahydrofolate cyclohydrolase